jgi:hypothetical protein
LSTRISRRNSQVAVPEGLVNDLDPAAPFHPANRRRLPAPGLRTFENIADQWQLTEPERLLIMGLPRPSTYRHWVTKVRSGADITLSVDQLIRISIVLGVYGALDVVFPQEGDALRWLRAPNTGASFGGQAPLTLVTSGTQDGLMTVRRHLDAWRGGIGSAPIIGFGDILAQTIEIDLLS